MEHEREVHERILGLPRERKFFIDNLLVRIHFIIVMIRWTGLASWEFEFPFPDSLASTFLEVHDRILGLPRHSNIMRYRGTSLIRNTHPHRITIGP